MRVTAEVVGSIEVELRGEMAMAERAVTRAVAGAGRDLQRKFRDQIRSSGLGGRLANTVRLDVFPKAQESLGAAALMYSNAPKIVGAHERGALIRSQTGFWLAVPLPGAGRSSRGGRITPAEWERKTGRRLAFVYRRGRTALLVDTGEVLRGARVMGRNGISRAARGFRNRVVPVFALVPQVRLRKRLDLAPLATQAAASIPAAIVRNWRSR